MKRLKKRGAIILVVLSRAMGTAGRSERPLNAGARR